MLLAEKREHKKESNFIGIYTVILAFIVIIALYLYIDNKTLSVQSEAISEDIIESEPVADEEELIEQVIVAEPVIKPVSETEIIESPAIEKESEVVVPVLNESDPFILALVLSDSPDYARLLIQTDIIRSFVVFTDNFSRGELVTKFSPLKKPDEYFSVLEKDKKIHLNEESYHRYDRYVNIIDAMDMDFVSREYLRLKALFDQAYQEIGYPKNSFDSALYNAIEVAVNTPVIRQPITLVAPSAMYKFADPQLEALPDAQKLMLRMGPDNIVKLRTKLQQFQITLKNL